MNNEFIEKYSHLSSNPKFSVSKAIMTMLEDNLELNSFTKGDFDLAVNFATRAWNLAIINDDTIIAVLLESEAKDLRKEMKTSLKQIESMLMTLIKLKNKLFGDVFRVIGEYDASFKDNEPYLKVTSGIDMPPDYFAKMYQTELFGKQKRRWVHNEDL